MRVLGIDPGLNITGFGVIESDAFKNFQMIRFGVIRTDPKWSLPERLYRIHHGVEEVILSEHPDVLAIEDIFYAENVKTAIVMGHARGAVIVAGMRNNIPVFEYSPREVKMSVVGNGAAAKTQVQFMVRSLLRLREPVQPLDASDALAVAICHSNRHPGK
jgi:crossover junction endodeoxyribonuclease RuvC